MRCIKSQPRKSDLEKSEDSPNGCSEEKQEMKTEGRTALKQLHCRAWSCESPAVDKVSI